MNNNNTNVNFDSKNKDKEHSVVFSMNKKISDIIIICIGILFLVVALFALLRSCNNADNNEVSNKAISQESTTTTSPPLNFTPRKQDTNKSIKIPTTTGFNMVAGQINQRVLFENPSSNQCVFQIRLYLSDNTLIWKSDYIKPSEKVIEEQLLTPLQSGIYKDCKLYYDCYSLDRSQKLNGGLVSVMINAY